MVSGFGLGGFAKGFEGGFGAVNTAIYDQGLLKLGQQRLQQEQQNKQRAEYMQLRSDGISHLQETMQQLRIAHPDWTDQQLASNPAVVSLKNMLGGFDKNLGLPDTIDSIVANFAARPSEAVTQGAIARAKEGPLKQELLQSEIQKNQALAGVNPDLDTSEALGTRGQPATFNERFAQAGIETPTKPEAMLPDQKGEVFLQKLPEGLRQQVKDLADYKINPTTFSLRTYRGQSESQRSKMVRLAEQYAAARGDTYDQRLYSASSGAIGNFYRGPEARTARSFNVLVDHLDTLKDATAALANKDNITFNQLKNAIATWTGKPAPNSFDAVKTVVADELVKAVIGSSSGALGDREAIQSTVTNANSPAQLASVIDRYQQLAGGQLSGLRTQFNGIPGSPGDFDKRFLNERTQKLLRITIPRSGTQDQGITVHGFTFTPSGQ